MNPTLLLAVAAAVFFAPATYLFAASLLSQQGSLAGRTISGGAEIAIWCAGVVCLLLPLSFPKLLRSAASAVRLLLALFISVGVAVFGLALTLTTGELAPIRVLATASMLAILVWTWVYRDCFRSEPVRTVIRRYTAILFGFGVLSLAYAALRIALWERMASASGGDAAGGYLVFINTAMGLAALAVARLRERGSPYTRPATRVLSWGLLLVPVMGTAAALYWLIAIRRREELSDPRPITAP